MALGGRAELSRERELRQQAELARRVADEETARDRGERGRRGKAYRMLTG